MLYAGAEQASRVKYAPISRWPAAGSLHPKALRCTNMSSSPTGCCAVQWAMWKGGGLNSHDRANSSESYLLLGFLLVKPSQAVLLLVKQSFT